MLKHYAIFALLATGFVTFSPARGHAVENSANSAGSITLAIEKSRNSIQGRHEFIDVTVTDGFKSASGYDLLLAFDPTVLTVYGATPAPKFYSDSGYQWEYFVYRFSQIDSCSAICPIGTIRVTGIAETNNGPIHPGGFGMIKGDLLFTIDFLIGDDRTLACTFSPIRFCWTDCDDNVLASQLKDTALISRLVIDHDGDTISNSGDPSSYPTYGGGQSSDCTPENSFGLVERMVDFVNGGVDIACAESLDTWDCIAPHPLDGCTGYTASDAIVFANYFVYGMAAFTVNREGQMAATDVNADGVPLTVADFAYLVRVIAGDANPFPNTGQEDAREIGYFLRNNVLAVNLEIGAAFVVLEGDVEPTNLSDLEMRFNYNLDADVTRVFFYSLENRVGTQGELLHAMGNIVSMEMATYEGAPVNLKSLPFDYLLDQNYPNPFNPSTVIAFETARAGSYELVITNALGQEIERFEGWTQAGRMEILWDAEEYASGVYFYRLQVEEFSESRKMVLLK